MLPLFDAHSHLPEANFHHPDLFQAICGTCEADWGAILDLASSQVHRVPLLGMHPWFLAAAAPGWALRLASLLQMHRAGVGECGLDFSRMDADAPTQEAAFRTQLRLAHALRRPLAIHCVRAWGRLLQLLQEEGAPPAGAMVHAYAGSLETARTLQAMGICLSFSGAILDPRRAKLRQVLAGVQPDRLLLETDGAADLAQLVDAAAAIRRTTPAAIQALTWENGQRCFKELLP